MKLPSYSIRILFVILLALGITPHAQACENNAVKNYTSIMQRMDGALLYVADNCESPPSYIFGTIHLDDEGIQRTAQPAFLALEKARRAIFEIKNSKKNQRDTVALMVLPPTEQRTLSAIVGKKNFEWLTHELLEVQPGFPLPLLERYRPWAASIMVQLPPPTADNIHLDDRLQLHAKKLSKDIAGMETPAEQMRFFSAMPENEQIELLQETLANIGTLREQNEQLKALYLKQDLPGIYRMGKKAFDEISDTELRHALRKALIFDRNEHMAESLRPYLKEGGVFVAVGALHLPGEKGLLHRLEKAGYYIWPANLQAAQ